MEKLTLKSLEERIIELENELKLIKESKSSTSTGRDRGPSSTREMTEDDARKVMIGELKTLSHKLAASELGLSYGQIYSARGGYTFKGVYAEMKEIEKKNK